MAYRKKSSTTRLPQSLVDEIDAQQGASSSGHGHKHASGPHNRKAERKAERELVKKRKAQFFSHGVSKQSDRRDGMQEAEESDQSRPRKKVKFEMPPESSSSGARKSKPATKNGESGRVGKKKKTIQLDGRVDQPSLKKRPPQDNSMQIVTKGRSAVEEEEDAYIALLERRLGIKKEKQGKSRYSTGFEEDGLLALLVDIDESVPGPADDVLKPLENEDADVEDEIGNESETLEANETESEGEEEEHAGSASESSDDERDSSEEVKDTQASDKLTIEGQSSSSGSKYVPPHLRKQIPIQQPSGAEVDAKLVRQLKGLLNRLSEQNIDSILKEIEDLYCSHRRHDITATLTSLIIEGTCSHSILLDSYVALHAGLVACLHKIIGVELAAYFVQNVVSSFERYYLKSKRPKEANAEESPSANLEDELGKECSNLLVLLSDLYNYHVISCTLVYDIVRLILEGDLSELDVELILKLSRGSGTQLRQDDPSALKEIIQIVQSKLGDERNASSRTRFMVETLINLKNNKLKKSTGGAEGGIESKERISKFVSGIGKKYHVHAHEPLRISLNDLHEADSKGKWWLIGAAWGGDPLVDQQTSLAQSTTIPSEDSLLTLARKQGMNTDVRRSVFVVLMSSDDYVDACDRLGQLNLTEVQQREIIRVLLHCCGNEKSYNPYYTLIATHLCCQKSHSHRITLQYCFWDFLRSLGEKSVGGAEMARGNDEEDEEVGFELDRVSNTRMGNVARMYAWLVVRDSVAITILKTLDFTRLKTKTKTFLKQFFIYLFTNTQDPSSVPNPSTTVDPSIFKRHNEKALADVLVKARRVSSLALGISHFLSKTFPYSDSRDPTEMFVWWCSGVAREVLQDAASDSQ